MRSIRSTNSLKNWARLAAKFGLLLTEPKVRAAIGDQLKDRADQVTDTIASNMKTLLIVWKRPELHYRAEATGLRGLWAVCSAWESESGFGNSASPGGRQRNPRSHSRQGC